MNKYNYKNDGKLHTRFSELVRCTPGQIDRVVNERLGLADKFESDAMAWGTARHERFADESRKTGRTPKTFGFDRPVALIEKEIACEPIPGVVLHSTIDAVNLSSRTVIDYKTMTIKDKSELPQAYKKAESYRKSLQLKIYAYQLSLTGLRIVGGTYMIEIWNHDRDEIMATAEISDGYSLLDIQSVVPWLQKRCSLLMAAMEAVV